MENNTNFKPKGEQINESFSIRDSLQRMNAKLEMLSYHTDEKLFAIFEKEGLDFISEMEAVARVMGNTKMQARLTDIFNKVVKLQTGALLNAIYEGNQQEYLSKQRQEDNERLYSVLMSKKDDKTLSYLQLELHKLLAQTLETTINKEQKIL